MSLNNNEDKPEACLHDVPGGVALPSLILLKELGQLETIISYASHTKSFNTEYMSIQPVNIITIGIMFLSVKCKPVTQEYC